MTSKSAALTSGTIPATSFALPLPGARRVILSLFSRMRRGGVRLELPDGTRMVLGNGGSVEMPVMRIRNDRFFSRLIWGGETAFGESYMDGDWEASDLTAVLSVFCRNMDVINSKDLWTAKATWLANRTRHFLNRNSFLGSRKNISYHYDIGNDFYRLMLDETMTYSAAMYRSAEDSLKDAQLNKINQLLDRVQAKAGDHILEIGSGWGALAMEAARRGCKVTTVTLSREQLRVVKQRVREAGLEDLVRPMLCDYRHVKGQFDKVISVEMIEAVGHEYLGTYFKHVDRLLKPNGIAAIQAITMPDERYEAYRQSPDWIQKYIFPGAVVPSIGALANAMASNSRLMIEDVVNFPIHYARTLREWSERFEENLPAVRALGYDDRFIRMWRYYLSYCEAGFATRMLGVVHMTLTRQANDTLPEYPRGSA